MQEKNITSSLNLTDEDIAYLAGYMEAYLTHSLMDNHWQNTMSNFCTSDPEMEELCRKLIYFIFENIAYITDKNLTDPLWYQVCAETSTKTISVLQSFLECSNLLFT